MNSRSIALALTVAAALALAACGSNNDKQLSKSAYRQQLHALSREDDKAHANVDGLPHAKSVAQMKAGMAAFATGEARIGRQVAALKPPADAAQANAALAKAFSDSATEMQHVQSAIRAAKTPHDALGIIGKLGPTLKSGHELDAALARLHKLGYATAD